MNSTHAVILRCPPKAGLKDDIATVRASRHRFAVHLSMTRVEFCIPMPTDHNVL